MQDTPAVLGKERIYHETARHSISTHPAAASRSAGKITSPGVLSVIHGPLVPQALPGLLQPSLGARKVCLVVGGGSLLANSINRLWVQALNERTDHGWTHFAMHHADVQAPAGWVDTLADEMARVGADVISAVVPIKDYRGLTSTGWRDPGVGPHPRGLHARSRRCWHSPRRSTLPRQGSPAGGSW